jgi:hypothetical protein
MNIFVLDERIYECVKSYVDKHVVKMILESAQMLSTTVRLSGIDAGYKATHINHPCTIWARESLSNWKWLRDLVYQMQEEWRYRYEHTKLHKSVSVVESLPEPKIEDVGLTSFALAMPDEYKCGDPVKSYRKYYIHGKNHIATWTKRNKPEWYG